jgi:hypothetical protein
VDGQGGGVVSAKMFKYLISSGTSMQVDVLMCEGAVIRAVGMQDDAIHAWAETPVDGDPFTVTRTFRVIGTGWPVPDPGTYLGTVFDGPYVWHVYEVAS